MRKALFIPFCLSILILNSVCAQNSSKNFYHLSYDELKREYFEVVKTDSEKWQLATTYISKARKENNSRRIAKGHYYLGLLYYENNPRKAIDCLDSVIKYSKNNPEKNFPLAAYREKAYMLRKLYKYEQAIENYNLAEKLAKKTNLNFYYKIRLDIAELKSEELNQVEEALSIYKECYNYYKTKDTCNKDYAYCYNQTLFDLADAYTSLNKPNLATLYNSIGYKNSIQIKDIEAQSLFSFNEASNLISQKKYKIGIDSIKKALPILKINKNQANIMASYFFLGKAYEGLNNKSEALKNYIRVDSMYQKGEEMYPELIHGYNFLINYYKSIGDPKLQLRYMNSLMDIENANQRKYRNLDKVIRKKYEIPQLLTSKEETIMSLKGKNKTAILTISFLTLFALSSSIYLYYQRKQKIKYKKRFEKIVAEYKLGDSENSAKETSSESRESKTEKNNDKSDISKVIIKEILQKLQQFEKKKSFLDPEVSLQSLSDKFETNTRYLSKIINEHKGKSFVQYINTLRVNYAIEALQEKSRLRKYSVNALAGEFGFNTGESFSNAFFKETGIKPSFFIKELNINTTTGNQ